MALFKLVPYSVARQEWTMMMANNQSIVWNETPKCDNACCVVHLFAVYIQEICYLRSKCVGNLVISRVSHW